MYGTARRLQQARFIDITDQKIFLFSLEIISIFNSISQIRRVAPKIRAPTRTPRPCGLKVLLISHVIVPLNGKLNASALKSPGTVSAWGQPPQVGQYPL